MKNEIMKQMLCVMCGYQYKEGTEPTHDCIEQLKKRYYKIQSIVRSNAPPETYQILKILNLVHKISDRNEGLLK